MKKTYDTAVERFWQRVKKGPVELCWPWYKPVTTPYPMLSFRMLFPHLVPAHRVAYFLHTGEKPYKCHICHRCNNKMCCNPNHLYAGDARTNQADSVAAGTAWILEPKKGEENHNAKLTVDIVIFVKRVYPLLKRHEKATLAKLTGVCRPVLYRIANGEGWAHVQAAT